MLLCLGICDDPTDEAKFLIHVAHSYDCTSLNPDLLSELLIAYHIADVFQSRYYPIILGRILVASTLLTRFGLTQDLDVSVLICINDIVSLTLKLILTVTSQVSLMYVVVVPLD